MKHMQQNKHWDCKFTLEYIVKNCVECRINKNYKERHEPTFNGVSISVRMEGEDTFMEFAANDEGWLYVSDWYAKDLDAIDVKEGILLVECNVERVSKILVSNE